MAGPASTAIADRPVAAFVAVVVVTIAIHVALQLAFDGRVDVARTAVFGLAVAASLVGFSIVRRRLVG